MAIVNYHCAKGRLIGEDTNGTRTDYMTDALGSVTGTVNSSQAVVNTYRYKPFGELLAKTGTGADPKFMWNGSTQSRRTGIAYSERYNRARHYGTRQGQWTTVDPLWPRERAYVYVLQRPSTATDPSGQKIRVMPSSDGGFSEPRDCCASFVRRFFSGQESEAAIARVKECMAGKGFKNETFVDQALRFFRDICNGGASNAKSGWHGDLCVQCQQGDAFPNGVPLPRGCIGCPPRAGAVMIWPVGSIDPPIDPPPDTGCIWIGPKPKSDPCANLHNSNICACTVLMCDRSFKSDQSKCEMLFHEAVHCGGVGGPPSHADMAIKHSDVIYALGCCVCEETRESGKEACNQCGGFAK